MARWINFERWFEFQKEPRVEKVISQATDSPRQLIKAELDRYNFGIIE